MMHRLLALGVITAALAAVPGPAQAKAPTCSEELGITVHGQHVVGDYVMGTDHGDPWPRKNVGRTIAGTGAALPGGPGPAFHFELGFAPGASFCNDQAKSAGLHF